MAKERDNAAESMKDVFALIRSRKQSGVLSVERFENGLFEEGEVHFQDGKPIKGVVGKLNGEPALRHLLSWRRISFAFSSTSASSNLNGLHSSPPSPLPPSSTPAVSYQLTPSGGPDIAIRIPHKLVNPQEVLSLSLTRLQRSIYLLIDDRRNVSDLARLTGKSIPEVLQILADLSERKLIRM